MHALRLTLVAFGFLNLPLLGWLAAAAIPIAIHLWARRRYREVAFAAMEYLLAAMKRRSRRLRMEQWLLLILRTLLVVLVVLAAAEPYWERPLLSRDSSGRTHCVLVVDGSYSMAYQPTDQSRFIRAKQIAREIVENAPAGDAFTLLLMSAPPRVVVGSPAPASDEMLAEIDALVQPHTTSDVASVLGPVQDVLETARRENPRLTRHEVFFLTDLQRAAWLPRGSQAALAEFREQTASLADAAAIVVIDVGQPAADNLAVGSLALLTSPAIAGRPCRFEATIKSFSAQPAARQSVELLVDGRRVAQRTVDVPPGGEAKVFFEHRFDAAGDHAVEVRAEGDSLPLDNRRYLSVAVRRRIGVLCIDGRPSGRSFGGATSYLAAALAPSSTAGAAASIEVDVAPESALLERDLTRYDCVAMCNVAQFTASEAAVLAAYLRAGGNLVFFLGDQVMPERYHRELGPEAKPEHRLLPAQLAGVVETPEGRLDPVEYQHPMMHAFRGAEDVGLLTSPVARHMRLVLAPDARARVVLRLPGGDPLIVEHAVHRGRVVLAATSADASWTAMPLLPGFVPLVHEMIAFCLSHGAAEDNILVGQPLRGVVASAGDAQTVDLRLPDGQRREIRLHGAGSQREWTFPDTWQSGIYAVRAGESDSPQRLHAVNVDTSESDLAQLGLDRLRSEAWPGVHFEYKTTWQEPERPQAVAFGGGAGRLHVLLLSAALACLLVETCLAWRFGYSKEA